MLPTLLLVALAVGIAVARGGSLDNLARTRFGWTWVLFAGLALQLLFELWTPSGLSSPVRLAITLVSIAAVLLFLVANRHLPGSLVAAAGLGMNVSVIIANGAMPVSLDAARVAGISFSSFNELGIKHEILNAGTRLRWIADVIPIPNTQRIFSAGDFVLAAGLAILAYRCTLQGEEQPATQEPEVSPRSASG
jgi:hypothetical protein